METPHGPVYMDVCKHEDCSDVVTGGVIPCGAARQTELFCGFKGRYFQEIPDKAEVVNIIQLVEKK
jgi:hypothetical protein